MVSDDRQDLAGLRWQWLIVAVLYATGLIFGYNLLRQVWLPADAAWWMTFSTATLVVQMGILWWALRYNHAPSDSTPFPFLGYANALTLVRGLLTCLLAGFLAGPPLAAALAWIPALLYTLERLIDFADGYVARVTRHETKLGAILDIEFDGLGLLVAVALAIQDGKLPAWYLILGLARPLFVAGMWLRYRLHKPVYELPPSEHRRIIAGFQTGFVSVVLWPVWSAQITLLAGYLFAVPLVFSFGRDWLVVSGVIDAGSASYAAARQTIKRGVEGWLPLAARLAGGLMALFLLGQLAPGYASWPAMLAGLWTLAAVLFLVGIASRVCALGLAALAAFDMLATGLQLDSGLLLACTVAVLHLGSGRYAIWQPEERILHTKLGAPGSADS